jgi:hypothetical protein
LRRARCAPPSLAAQLGGGEFGDGQVHRVAHAVVRELLTSPPKQCRTEPSRQEEVLRGFGASP